VYLFLFAFFLSGFNTFGLRHASLYKSKVAILSRLNLKLKDGPTSLNGIAFFFARVSETYEHSKWLISIGSVKPRQVNTITLYKSAILPSYKS